MVGGVSCKEMKSLEMIFLHEIKFELFVSKKLYGRYLMFFNNSLKRASKPKSRGDPTRGTLPVQAFSSKLITRNGTVVVENTQSQKYANNISSRKRNEQQTYRHFLPKQIGLENKEHRFTRARSPFYMHVRCFGTELRNWHNTREPLIGSA